MARADHAARASIAPPRRIWLAGGSGVRCGALRLLAVALPLIGPGHPLALAQAPSASETPSVAQPATADPAAARPDPAAARPDPAAAKTRQAMAATRQRLAADAPQALWDDLEAGRYADALPRLLALESRWAMDADYNTLLAETALAARRYPEASLALERLVLLEPGNAGAWLDLAIASEAMGDVDTARRALDTLARDFPAPPGIRIVTTGLRARLMAAEVAPAAFRMRAGMMFGRDSNVNGGLSVGSLTLTPAGSSIELPVDPAYRARASAQWLATLEGSGRWETRWGPIEGRISLAEKRRTSEPDFDTREIAVAAAGQVPRTEHTYWLAEFRRVEMGHRPLLVIPRVRVGRDLRFDLGACRPSVGGELELRQYRADLAAYDGRILWLDAGLRCPAWGGSAIGVLRFGNDRGSADRPGGDTFRQELAVAWYGQIADKLDLLAGTSLSRSADDTGYSPLILNNVARRISRVSARAELVWRLGGGWQTVASAEHSRQDSNLGLFGYRQTVVMTGLRYVH